MSRISPELALVDPELREAARALLPEPPDCLAPRPRIARRPVVAPSAPPRPAHRGTPAPHTPVVPRPLADPPRPVPASAPAPVERRSAPPRRHARRLGARTFALVGAWVVALLFVLSPLLAFAPPPGSQVPRVAAPDSDGPVLQHPRKQAQTAHAGTKPAATSPRPVPPTLPSQQRPRKRATPRSDSAHRSPKAAREKKLSPARKPKSPPPAVKEKQRASRPTVLSWRSVPGTTVYNVIFVGGGKRIDVWSADNRLELDVAETATRAIEYTWFAYPGFRSNGGVRYGDLVAHGTTRVPRTAIPRTQPPAGGQVR